MAFEITIEGPFRAVSELFKDLETLPSPPSLERIASSRPLAPERGRITILEHREDRVDPLLLEISRSIRKAKGSCSSVAELHVITRNLSYSEPSAGSSRFMEPFHPIPSLTIQPWVPGLQRPEDPLTVVLDPSHAFGTGKHPTTVLCLRAMELFAKTGSRGQSLTGSTVLDFGCGTGLLAMAAVKMGARQAVGVELDVQSAQTARDNVALNNLSGRVIIREGSWETVREKYDFLFANVVISALLRTGANIPDYMSHDGTAVVSGFGENQIQEVRSFFEGRGLRLREEFFLNGWGAAFLSR